VKQVDLQNCVGLILVASWLTKEAAVTVATGKLPRIIYIKHKSVIAVIVVIVIDRML